MYPANADLFPADISGGEERAPETRLRSQDIWNGYSPTKQFADPLPLHNQHKSFAMVLSTKATENWVWSPCCEGRR